MERGEGKTKNARERELCFRIPDSEIYVSRKTEKKKMSYFELKNI